MLSPFVVFQPSTGKLPVFARGFRSLLKYIKDKYANPEIMIMENGTFTFSHIIIVSSLFYLHLVFKKKQVLNRLIFLGYGEDLGETDSVAVGIADHNRKYYLQRHLLSMNEAIWYVLFSLLI